MVTSSGWDNLIYWGKPVNGQCNDFANAKKLVPARQPTPSADQKTFTVVINAGEAGGSPVVGDCVYLNVDGTQTDKLGNIPPIRGVELRGRRPPRVIELFRGFPPVVGLTAENPGFILVTNDPRKGDQGDFSKPDASGTYVITWIPPADYPKTVGVPYTPLVPGKPTDPAVGTETTVAIPFPRTISAVQVVSTGKYIADVSIFDTHGKFMKSFRQAFGYRGELNNGARVVSKGLVSYLVWDMKDSKNQKAGQGVYIWKVLFSFENGKQEIQYTRTGVMRNGEW
jgi:hypothetical protein